MLSTINYNGIVLSIEHYCAQLNTMATSPKLLRCRNRLPEEETFWVKDHVQRTIEEVNERLAIALTGVRLARAKTVRWANMLSNFVLQCRVAR